jgi:transcriptional regulator with XRE-family HTH domain
MNEKTFLPGTIGQRLSDLCTAAGITIKELSEKTCLEYSTLSRIKNDKNQKVAHEVVLKLARFFNVSADFLLGLTNIPDMKNYTAEELGLSADAVKNLYTGVVDNRVADLLLSSPEFATLTAMLADYFDENQASVIAVQNQIYQSTADLMLRISRTQKALRKPAGIEAKKALAQRQPLYKTELAQMETQFSKTIKAIKKDLPSHLEEKKKLTKEIFDQMIRDLTKGGEAAEILAVTKGEIIDSIVSRLDGLDIAEEDKDTLRKALLPVFSGNGVRDG